MTCMPGFNELCRKCEFPKRYGESCLYCEARSNRRWMILALAMGILAFGISLARLLWDLL